MEILLTRIFFFKDRTIGRLFINDVYLCDTLEDCNRDINKNGIFDNQEKKIYGKTCIPYGTYKISLDTISPKFSKMSFYKEVCNGKLPRLLNVSNFNGILIHCANGPKGPDLLEGCIGVGNITEEWYLENSKEVFKTLYNILKNINNKGEDIFIKII